MRFQRAGACIALVMTLVAATAAQNSAQAEKQFQAALQKEMVAGDLKGAIEIYKQVVAQAGSNRALAAKALLKMAECHQKLGNTEAQKVYLQIVRDYAEQAEARVARAQLEPSQEPMPKKLWTSTSGGILDVTLDGTMAIGRRFFVDDRNVERQDLFLRNVASGQESLLVNSSTAGAVMEASFSPDSQRVAYVGLDRSNGRPRRTLKVIGIAAGAEARTVFVPDASLDSFSLVGWLPDGRTLVSVFYAGSTAPASLVSIAVSDGSVRILKTFAAGVRPGRVRLSNDGLWIAYEQWSTGRLHVVKADGQQDAEVVKWTGDSTFPVWTPDGSHIVFTSSRSGWAALYAVPIRNGAATAEPSLVQANFTGSPLRVLRSGSLVYQSNSGAQTMVFVARRTAGGADVLFSFGGSSPAISPDGESVVFDVTAGAVVVRSLATGAERVFKRAGIGGGTGGGYLHKRWLPDSSGLLLWVTPEGDAGREGGSFYHLDLKTGAFTWRFAAFTQDMHLSRAGALSRDGQTFFLLGRRPSESRWTRIVHVDPVSGKFRSEALLEGGGLAEGASVFSIAVSPDDRTLAVEYALPASPLDEARMHILSVATDGSRAKELSSHRSSRSPDQMAWAPDGRAVLAGVVEGGVWRVMRIPADGGSPEFDSVDLSRLSGSVPAGTVNASRGDYGGISRDGSLIVFSASLTRGTEVWSLENLLPRAPAKR